MGLLAAAAGWAAAGAAPAAGAAWPGGAAWAAAGAGAALVLSVLYTTDLVGQVLRSEIWHGKAHVSSKFYCPQLSPCPTPFLDNDFGIQSVDVL